MKWNANFGIGYGRCQHRMEDNLPYFHINSILDFDYIYGKYIWKVVNDILTEVLNICSISCGQIRSMTFRHEHLCAEHLAATDYVPGLLCT